MRHAPAIVRNSNGTYSIVGSSLPVNLVFSSKNPNYPLSDEQMQRELLLPPRFRKITTRVFYTVSDAIDAAVSELQIK